MSLGSVGQAFAPFEKEFTLLVRNTSSTLVDGWALEDQKAGIAIKGIIIPRPTTRVEGTTFGGEEEGEASLHIRTERQTTLPSIQDEIVDDLGVSWIVIAERDYSSYVNHKLYIIRRKR